MQKWFVHSLVGNRLCDWYNTGSKDSGLFYVCIIPMCQKGDRIATLYHFSSNTPNLHLPRSFGKSCFLTQEIFPPDPDLAVSWCTFPIHVPAVKSLTRQLGLLWVPKAAWASPGNLLKRGNLTLYSRPTEFKSVV